MCKVSVIVPCYGVEEHLCECIDSILAQDFTDFELILVDDGSPDRCGEIIEEYRLKDERVRTIHKDNGGVSSARNAALDCARGTYVCFVDGDDYVEPNLLSTVVALMDEGHSSVAFGYRLDPARKVGAPDWRITTPVAYDPQTPEEHLDFILSKFMKAEFHWQVWSRLFRRDIIERHGLRFIDSREAYAEDFLFCLCYLICEPEILCIPDILYSYRKRPGSLSRTDADSHRIKTWSELAYWLKGYLAEHPRCSPIADRYDDLYTGIMAPRFKRVVSEQMMAMRPISETRRYLEANVCDYEFFKERLVAACRESKDRRALFECATSARACIIAAYVDALYGDTQLVRTKAAATVGAASIAAAFRGKARYARKASGRP